MPNSRGRRRKEADFRGKFDRFSAFCKHALRTLPQLTSPFLVSWHALPMTTKEQYAILHPALNELQWRMYLGTEAARIGYGGISIVARASGADRKTIRKGMREITPAFSKGRVQQAGGGRKKSTQKDATLVADLESLLEPKGDPMSLVRWTTQSLATLVRALTEKKHTIKKSALAGILAMLGFSLKANKKNIEGVSHPDRDRQFQFIKKSG